MIISEQARRLRTKKRTIIEIESASAGVSTLISPTRLNKNQAAELTNMWLVEDGVPAKRPGTAAWGNQTFSNRPDGFKEFTKSNGTREMIIVADGVVQRVTTSSKTTISGATFTQGTRVFMIQYAGFLYIVNGVDPMARYDGTNLTKYTALSAPGWAGTPLARNAGLSSGSVETLYYQITAVNDVGETVASTEESIANDKARVDWDAANESIVLDWDSVSGATRYNIYVTDTTGFEEYLATVTDTGFTD